MLTIQKKSLEVGRFVDTDHVNTTVREYKKERWVHNSRRLGKEDSLTVWYSAEELENFLAEMKTHGADGVKMCFAAYPADYAENPDYAGRQTIVLVATRRRESAEGSFDKEVYIQTENGPSVLAYNTGRICPPYCGQKTGDGDDWGGIGISIIDKGDEGIVVV